LSNTIEGLTPQQVVLCDLLWSSDYPETMIRLMPPDMAREATTLMQLIVLSEIDQIVAEMPQSTLQENYQNLFG
jgi:hypothetical protein